MTREELRDYVDEQRSLNSIPYDVYSTLIDGIDTLEQEPCDDCVSRQEALKEMQKYHDDCAKTSEYTRLGFETAMNVIRDLPPVQPKTDWIPVSEKPPKDLEPVNITWVDHNPEGYYADTKDKPFTATGVRLNGQWYWWSTLCADILTERSHNYDDAMIDDIEVTAWQPLPLPWEGE